jgi:acyl carrier protein
LLESHLREQVARVLAFPASQLDIDQPLNDLGLDSLMAIELKNRIEMELRVRVPMATLLQGPTLAQLTAELLDQMVVPPLAGLEQERRGEPEEIHSNRMRSIGREEAQRLLADLDHLSDTEVQSLLNDLLAEEEEGEQILQSHR